MWWRELFWQWRRCARLLVVLAAAGLTAGCFEPLYGTHPAVNSESVQDKFAAIEIPPIIAPKGDPAARIAVGMFNALQFNLHNGAGANAPTYRLVVQVGASEFTAVVDPTTGRPDAQIDTVTASYRLIELATGKVVLNDNCSAHVDFDIPGSQQRFTKQRAQRDAEDRAITVAADTIRNRLASYFVAGT
jgi:LPS-assembly lipoprotein